MDVSSAESAAAFAETLIKTHAKRDGDILATFAAFVALVVLRDEVVGFDCLKALDRLVCGAGERVD